MADYKTKKNHLSAKLKNALIMPVEHRSYIVEQNLKRLTVLNWFLIFAGIIMDSLIVANNLYQNHNQKVIIYFFSILTIISAISLIWCYFFKNKTTISSDLRAIGHYITFLAIMCLCLVSFLHLFAIFSAFIYFICAVIVFSLVFYMEPFFFSIVLISIISAMIPKLVSSFGIPAIIVVIFFSTIMVLIVFSRWNSTIKMLNAQSEQKRYTSNLEKEITLASFVQKSFFTHNVTEFDGWTLNFYSEPMAGISGDMFDIYNTDNKLDGLGLFDVSGHGLSSGLVTMLVKNIIYKEFYKQKDKPLQQVLNYINDRIIREKGDIENFLTGTLARINGNNVEFINAGNPQPIIYVKEKNNAFFYENSNQNHYGVIGMADFPVNYTSTVIKMNSGDEILFYTDGITENTNKSGLSYGKDLLLETFKINTFKTCKDQISDLIANYKSFKGNFRSSDDITLLLLKKL